MSGSVTALARQLHRQLGQILAAPVLHPDNDPLEVVRAAHKCRDAAEALLAAAVQEARREGRTWQEIGEVLGVSRQAAFQRYGKPIDPRNGEAMNLSLIHI